jgi:hypothetical protein
MHSSTKGLCDRVVGAGASHTLAKPRLPLLGAACKSEGLGLKCASAGTPNRRHSPAAGYAVRCEVPALKLEAFCASIILWRGSLWRGSANGSWKCAVHVSKGT